MWLLMISVVFAFMRLATNRSSSGLTVWSSDATTYQDGLVFQAAPGYGLANTSAAGAMAVAHTNFCSSAERSPQKYWVPVSGLPSGASPNFSPASGSASGFSSTLTVATAAAPPGTYGLTLTGTDARALIGGSRSSTLSLTILTPAQAIPNVIATVQGLHTGGALNGGQANSFIVKLNHAIDSLTSKPGQPTGCNQLQAFVNEVNGYVSGGNLTPAQADTLLGGPLGIKAIMAAVPC